MVLVKKGIPLETKVRPEEIKIVPKYRLLCRFTPSFPDSFNNVYPPNPVTIENPARSLYFFIFR